MSLSSSASDRERLSHIEDAVDGGDNKRVQIMNSAFSPLNNWILVKNGNNIQASYPTSNVEVYQYRESTTVIYEITVTYTNSTKEILSSVARTA